jgi:putative redox protein
MSIDVVDILTKGRHPVTGLRVAITAERAQEPPRRVTAATIRFHVHGDVPASAVERAIALSHDKYCSVWHSMRQDVELSTTFEVLP